MWSKIGRALVKAAVWACGHKEVVEIAITLAKNKGELKVPEDLPPGVQFPH